MFIATLFKSSLHWKQPKFPSACEKINCYIFIKEFVLNSKRNRVIGKCNNMNELQKQDNKQTICRYVKDIQGDFIYMNF